MSDLTSSDGIEEPTGTVRTMPLYEYQCPSCKAEVEVLQRMDDPPPKCAVPACPSKGKGDMQKQVSRTNFELKGGGWAKDGYGT